MISNDSEEFYLQVLLELFYFPYNSETLLLSYQVFFLIFVKSSFFSYTKTKYSILLSVNPYVRLVISLINCTRTVLTRKVKACLVIAFVWYINLNATQQNLQNLFTLIPMLIIFSSQYQMQEQSFLWSMSDFLRIYATSYAAVFALVLQLIHFSLSYREQHFVSPIN